MTSSNVYFIICCVLALLATIIFTILSVVLYKKEQALKSPYYFCDSDWECCKEGETGCDANLGKGISKVVPTTYKMSERFIPGSPYHQNCVLPIINAIKNYQGPGAHGFDFGYIYGQGSDPGNNPSPYYPGCSGPGSTYVGTKTECTDPTLNPYYAITAGVCPYSSTDAPKPSNPDFQSQPDVTKAILASGNGTVSNSQTLTPSNWGSATSTSAYIAGFNSSGSGGSYSNNGYTCPYNIPNGGSSATNTVNNSKNNWLQPIPPPP